jgi:hypothetical protein
MDEVINRRSARQFRAVAPTDPLQTGSGGPGIRRWSNDHRKPIDGDAPTRVFSLLLPRVHPCARTSIAVLRNRPSVGWKVTNMIVWEIQAQYAAARESGDTIEILQAQAREIAKAEAHAVAISEGDGEEAAYTCITGATFARVYAETLLGAQRAKTTPRSLRSRK